MGEVGQGRKWTEVWAVKGPWKQWCRGFFRLQDAGVASQVQAAPRMSSGCVRQTEVMENVLEREGGGGTVVMVQVRRIG